MTKILPLRKYSWVSYRDDIALRFALLGRKFNFPVEHRIFLNSDAELTATHSISFLRPANVLHPPNSRFFRVTPIRYNYLRTMGHETPFRAQILKITGMNARNYRYVRLRCDIPEGFTGKLLKNFKGSCFPGTKFQSYRWYGFFPYQTNDRLVRAKFTANEPVSCSQFRSGWRRWKRE
ncbi:hypothetical protein [Acinetobacter baumannii]|uniref:hypothetical protein n=1 Tax=Acinetobacter baumannii TaxID=470 RepID=UPI00313C2047